MSNFTFFPGEGNGNPLQYSCLESPMDRGAWRGTVHGGHKESLKPAPCNPTSKKNKRLKNRSTPTQTGYLTPQKEEGKPGTPAQGLGLEGPLTCSHCLPSREKVLIRHPGEEDPLLSRVKQPFQPLSHKVLRSGSPENLSNVEGGNPVELRAPSGKRQLTDP